VLSCEPTLLIRWLIPRLPALSEAAPGLDVHLSAAGGPVDFGREGIDLAIRRNDFTLLPGTHALWLFDEMTGPVATPELAQRLTTIADMQSLPRLHTRTRPSAWDDWARCHKTALPPAPARTFEHFYLTLQAATCGLGIAIGPRALVHDDLTAGRLTAPFGFEADSTAYFLLTTGSPHDRRVANLLTWLRSQALQMEPETSTPSGPVTAWLPIPSRDG
jgi:DNA-binding transcriptional LysR family regulator